MSISSISNPTALLSQVTGKNPFAVATPLGTGKFASTLLQELQQAGVSSAPGSTTGATSALHHGHHGGGMSQLLALLQQNQANGSAGSTAAGSGVSSLQLQALLQNLKNGASATPGRVLSTAV